MAKLTDAQELALELAEEREKRRSKTINITAEQWEEINTPANVDPKKIPPVFKWTDENDHPFKETEGRNKVRQFLMDAASEVLDEMSEEEQEERYQEDMDRLEEEFQDSLLERRRGQAGVNPFTGGSHHCRYVDPRPTTDPSFTLDDIRSVVREELDLFITSILRDYHLPTKMEHDLAEANKKYRK